MGVPGGGGGGHGSGSQIKTYSIFPGGGVLRQRTFSVNDVTQNNSYVLARICVFLSLLLDLRETSTEHFGS